MRPVYLQLPEQAKLPQHAVSDQIVSTKIDLVFWSGRNTCRVFCTEVEPSVPWQNRVDLQKGHAAMA